MDSRTPSAAAPSRRISPADVETLKARVNIVDIVEEHAHLAKASGGNIKALCPFHDEKTPSFNLRPAEGRYHCFGCEADGDVISFVQRIEGIDFVAACEVLAAKVGLQLRYDTGTTSPARPRKKKPAPPAGSTGKLPKAITQEPAEDDPCGVQCRDHELIAYPYIDEQGTILGENVRMDCVSPARSKCFKQRHLDDHGKVTWSGWDRQVPYRLPELIDAIADTRTVWLVEGEKDADRLSDLGECATTNAAGALNFNDALVPWFKDADVHVVLDRDKAGYERGLKLERLLRPVVRTLRISIPDVEADHADVSDHLDAGRGLADFVRVTSYDLRTALAKIEAADHLARAHLASAESRAQHERSADDSLTDKAREDASRFARRWAWEATSRTGRIAKAHAVAVQAKAAQSTLDMIADAREESAQLARDAWEHLNEVIPPEAVETLASGPITAPPDNDDAVAPDNVRQLRVVQNWEPEARVRMSTGQWGYSESSARRGIWMKPSDKAPWTYAGFLPWVTYRIIRRDGSGRRVGTDYVIAADDDAVTTTVADRQSLRDGQWASDLGITLSHDDKIQRATATAIEQIAENSPEREAVIRVAPGEVPALPCTQTAPDGYFERADADHDHALADWRRIVELLDDSPDIAFALGTAAISPWLSALGDPYDQSYLVALVGLRLTGKTTVLKLAGGIYGRPFRAGTVENWNVTPRAPERHLGQLGVLPAFFDEGGLSGLTPEQFGARLNQLVNGASRTGANRTGGLHKGLPWTGVLLATANGSFVDDDSTAGAQAGLGRRSLELNGPFTRDAAHGEELHKLLESCYGHLADPLLQHTSTTVRQYLDAEAEFVDSYGITGEGIATTRIMQTVLAGARLIDEVLGTDTRLRDLTAATVHDILDSWTAPIDDADRILNALRDRMSIEKEKWPTLADYRMNLAPYDPTSKDTMPRHGVARSIAGITETRDDGRETVAISPSYWKILVQETGVDKGIALRELDRRGLVCRTKQERRERRWTTKVRLAHPTNMYKLLLPEEPTNDGTDATDPPDHEPPALPVDDTVETPESGDVPEEYWEHREHVPSDVPSEKPPLTSNVPNVPNIPPRAYTHTRAREDANDLAEQELLDESQPCESCGKPCVIRRAGHVLHAFCHLASPDDRDDAAAAVDDSHPSAPPAQPIEPTPAPQPAAIERPRRWAGPAIVADVDRVVLPDESTIPLPENLTDLAALGELTDTHAIAWGGTKNSLPEPGIVVVTQALAARLGLRTEPFGLGFENSPEHDDTDMHSAIIGVRNSGWEITRRYADSDQLDWRLYPWMTFKAPGRRPFRVHFPHLQAQHKDHDTKGLYDSSDDPETIARRSRRFAEIVGISYRLSPSVTGVDLLRDMRTRSGRATMLTDKVDGNPAQGPNRYFDLMTRRLPSNDETAMPWLHRHDACSAYLASCSRLQLGTDVPPTHLTAPIDLSAGIQPGYYKIAARPALDLHEHCPDPIDGNFMVTDAREKSGFPARDWRWISAPKLRLLTQDLRLDVEITEAWIWTEHAPYLDQWYERIRDALYETGELRLAGDLDGDVLRATVKNLYAHGIGRFAALNQRIDRDGHKQSTHVLWRPDWRDQIIDETYRRIWLKVHRTGEQTGRWPLVINRDSLWYPSANPDASADIPAGLKQHPYKLGHFKIEGTTPIDEVMPFLRGEVALGDIGKADE